MKHFFSYVNFMAFFLNRLNRDSDLAAADYNYRNSDSKFNQSYQTLPDFAHALNYAVITSVIQRSLSRAWFVSIYSKMISKFELTYAHTSAVPDGV